MPDDARTPMECAAALIGDAPGHEVAQPPAKAGLKRANAIDAASASSVIRLLADLDELERSRPLLSRVEDPEALGWTPPDGIDVPEVEVLKHHCRRRP
jgi:hypothetical protein